MIEVKLCSLKGSHPFSEEDAIRESSDAESTHGYDSEDEADEEEMAPRPSSAKEKKRGGHKLIWGCVLGTAIKVKPAKGTTKDHPLNLIIANLTQAKLRSSRVSLMRTQLQQLRENKCISLTWQ